MTRGRLIHPLLAEIARLDTAATATAGGYDPDFKTLRTSYPGGVRTSSRVEHAPVQVPAQVEMGAWEGQNQMPAGNAPDSRLTLVLHYLDLKGLGLLDADGRSVFRVDDRLVRILDLRTKVETDLVRPEAGGLYCVRAEPAGLGLSGYRNLVLLTFEARPRGLKTAA